MQDANMQLWYPLRVRRVGRRDLPLWSGPVAAYALGAKTTCCPALAAATTFTRSGRSSVYDGMKQCDTCCVGAPTCTHTLPSFFVVSSIVVVRRIPSPCDRAELPTHISICQKGTR